jgi:hypothetical protein
LSGSNERTAYELGAAAESRLRRTRSSARQARKRFVKHTRIIVTHYGGPDALQVLEEECPEPKDGEVRVRGPAAGVSLPDLMMREGVHPEAPPLPRDPAQPYSNLRLRSIEAKVAPAGYTVSEYPIQKSYIREDS